jgi:hypothetical protein
MRPVYKFKLQARLVKLEKKLKLSAEEQRSAHFSALIEKLQAAKDIYIEAIRVWEKDSVDADKDGSTAQDDLEMIDAESTLDSWVTISKGDSSPVKRGDAMRTTSLVSRRSVSLKSEKESSPNPRSKSPVKSVQASTSKTVQSREVRKSNPYELYRVNLSVCHSHHGRVNLCG